MTHCTEALSRPNSAWRREGEDQRLGRPGVNFEATFPCNAFATSARRPPFLRQGGTASLRSSLPLSAKPVETEERIYMRT